jgi:hypothetical protein
MPAGDASRTWFLEMLVALRTKCRSDLSFPDLIGLRAELDAMLHRIRFERHIRPPVIKSKCGGHVGAFRFEL